MGWAEALDDMEARLAQAERVLCGGGDVPPDLTLPPGLGPIPGELVGRAMHIKADTDRLVGELSEARVRIATAMRRHNGAPDRGPAYIDTRA